MHHRPPPPPAWCCACARQVSSAIILCEGTLSSGTQPVLVGGAGIHTRKLRLVRLVPEALTGTLRMRRSGRQPSGASGRGSGWTLGRPPPIAMRPSRASTPGAAARWRSCCTRARPAWASTSPPSPPSSCSTPTGTPGAPYPPGHLCSCVLNQRRVAEHVPGSVNTCCFCASMPCMSHFCEVWESHYACGLQSSIERVRVLAAVSCSVPTLAAQPSMR